MNIKIDTSLFENFKSNNAGDTINLIAFLKSYSVLNDLARKNNLTYTELTSKIKIEKSTINNKKADGVIDINLLWKNKIVSSFVLMFTKRIIKGFNLKHIFGRTFSPF